MDALLNPIVFFFILGLAAGLLKSDLKIPETLYESLSIYLLLAIGLKGGKELSKVDMGELVLPLLATGLVGVIIPILAFFIAFKLFRYSRNNAAALATHYGSVSAVTFAVCIDYLVRLNVNYDPYVTVMIVILEIPALAIGVMFAKMGSKQFNTELKAVMHEVIFGKSIFLLVGGLIIGYIVGLEKMQPLDPVFVDPFKGALAFFLLEMGLVVSKRIGSIKRFGLSLIGFSIAVPLLSGAIGTVLGTLCGLKLGSIIVLATLSASASYIAAPAAVRVGIPKANPAIYLTASLGITFPFNVVIGIPIYHKMALWLQPMIGA